MGSRDVVAPVPRPGRVFLRLTLPPLLKRLAGVWVMLAVAYGILQQVLDFPSYRLALANQTPLAHGTTFAIIVGGWSLLLSRSLQRGLYQPSLRFLYRLPITTWSWGLLLWPLLVVASFPMVLVALLTPGWPAGFETLAWLAWSGCLLVASGHRSSSANLYWLGLLASGILAAALGQWWRGAWGFLALTSVVGGVGLSGWLHSNLRGRRDSEPMSLFRGRGSGTYWALVKRDWSCLWRAHRGLLLIAALVIMGLGGLAALFHRQGVSGSTLAVTMLVLVSPLSGQVVTRLLSSEGRHFFAGRWPTPIQQRMLSLLSLTALPSGAMLLIILLVYGGLDLGQLLLTVSFFIILSAGHTAFALWSHWHANGPFYMLNGSVLLALTSFGMHARASVIHLVGAALALLWLHRLLRRYRERFHEE